MVKNGNCGEGNVTRASCVNTVGSYTCNCNTGFENEPVCSGLFVYFFAFVEYQEFNSSYIFFYIQWYMFFFKYGLLTKFYADVNECLSNPCSVDAECQNTDGCFTCTCKDGFNGTGIICNGKLN